MARGGTECRLIAAVRCVIALDGSRREPVAISTATAPAQGMPSPFVQEVLVKSILLTLNDAVAADNFTVMHAKISKPFRDQFPPEKLRSVFKDLIEKHARVRRSGGKAGRARTATPRSTRTACCG